MGILNSAVRRLTDPNTAARISRVTNRSSGSRTGAPQPTGRGGGLVSQLSRLISKR